MRRYNLARLPLHNQVGIYLSHLSHPAGVRGGEAKSLFSGGSIPSICWVKAVSFKSTKSLMP